ncbi:MAG: hypothetical protein U5L95_01980 [Candidatus Saccharibacteria bacterium]|nr:hypothetical protein [Candidatus Saccharibacteria bacterium]
MKVKNKKVLFITLQFLSILGLFFVITVPKANAAFTKERAHQEYYVCDSPSYVENHLQRDSEEKFISVERHDSSTGESTVHLSCHSSADLIKVQSGSTMHDTSRFAALFTCGSGENPGTLTFDEEKIAPSSGAKYVTVKCSNGDNFDYELSGAYGGCSSRRAEDSCDNPTITKERDNFADTLEENASRGENAEAVEIASDCEEGIDPDNCKITDYLRTFTNVLIALVGIVVVIMVVVGGIQYSAARDNPQAVQAAKGRIANAVLALIVYIFMSAFLQYIIPGGVL